MARAAAEKRELENVTKSKRASAQVSAAAPFDDDAFLSEARIVEAARRLIENGSVENVTMRRVAEALGVTAMALYHHVADKQALLTLVANSVIAMVPDPDEDAGTWDEKLRQGLLAVHDETIRYPGLELHVWRMSGFHPSGAQKLERTVQLLMDAGFDRQEARRANFVLLAYSVGYFLTRRQSDGAMSPSPSNKSAGSGPVTPGDLDIQLGTSFELGLDIVLDGIRARLAART